MFKQILSQFRSPVVATSAILMVVALLFVIRSESAILARDTHYESTAKSVEITTLRAQLQRMAIELSSLRSLRAIHYGDVSYARWKKETYMMVGDAWRPGCDGYTDSNFPERLAVIYGETKHEYVGYFPELPQTQLLFDKALSRPLTPAEKAEWEGREVEWPDTDGVHVTTISF